MVTSVNAEVLKGAFILGAKRLESKKDYINELNVFPVPDGDTGTNMAMTVNAALNDIINTDYSDPISLCKAISQGSLKGARGNSGVILSQLFRGFYKVIKTADEVDVLVLTEAFIKATETAYRAVMKPKEGTILTVAKAISEKASNICNDISDIGAFYDELVEAGTTILDKTPEMLPVLKQAGVVDSGGAGLMEILRGAADFINGRDTDLKIHKEKKAAKETTSYEYNLVFDVICPKKPASKDKSDLEVYLESLGKLISLSADGNSLHINIDTNEPGRAIHKASKLGTLTNLTLVNNKPVELKAEKEEEPLGPPKDMGVVTVSSGDGLAEIFTGLGVDFVIRGGQTMNPSTDDILEAIGKVNAKNVFVLPNNKNILLAANQAAELCEDKKVFVVPTTTLPQGICAMINYAPEGNCEDNFDSMSSEISFIKSGEVTHAVRDTKIDDKDIKKGDFMGIGDEGIISVEKTINKAIDSLVSNLVDEESSLISLYFGEDVKEADAAKLAKKLEKKYPELEIDLQNGGQPVYYYILSVE